MNFKNTIFFSGMAVLLSFLILNGSSMTYQSSFAAEAAAATEYEQKIISMSLTLQVVQI